MTRESPGNEEEGQRQIDEVLSSLPPFRTGNTYTGWFYWHKGILSSDDMDPKSAPKYLMAVDFHPDREESPSESIFLLRFSSASTPREVELELERPYGWLMNQATKMAERLASAGDEGATALAVAMDELVERQERNRKNPGTTLEFSDRFYGTDTSTIESLRPFLDRGYTEPKFANQVISDVRGIPEMEPPHMYYVGSLVDACYFPIRYARDAFEARVIVRKCSECGKVFFARRRSSKHCYFPNEESGGNPCCEGVSGEAARKRNEVNKRVRKLLNRLSNGVDDKAYREFQSAWNEFKNETEGQPDKYGQRLEWLDSHPVPYLRKPRSSRQDGPDD